MVLSVVSACNESFTNVLQCAIGDNV